MLREHVFAEIDGDIQSASRRLRRVLQRLFGGLEIKSAVAESCFISAVVEIFARYGDEWVHCLTGRVTPEDLLTQQAVDDIIERAFCVPEVGHEACSAATRRCREFLLDSSDPDYVGLKFAMGQCFYAMKLLGLHKPMECLSGDLFRGGRLYLDSNVIIEGLVEGSKYHRAFLELIKICRVLEVTVGVTDETLHEIGRVVARQREISPVFETIPDDLAPKTRGTFFEAYRRNRVKDPRYSADTLFEPFGDLSGTLPKLGICIDEIDEVREARSDQELDDVKRELNLASMEVRGKPKTANALHHDGLMYLFVQRARASDSKRVWFVNVDSSLALASTRLGGDHAPFCLSLSGFLQALSPFVELGDEAEALSDVLGRIVGGELVPQEQVFEPSDFLVFYEIGVDCRTLPGTVVEEAVLHIKDQILKGSTYSREHFDEAAYYIRTHFGAVEERAAAAAAERDQVKGQLQQLEAAWNEQRGGLSKEIAGLEEDAAAREREYAKVMAANESLERRLRDADTRQQEEVDRLSERVVNLEQGLASEREELGRKERVIRGGLLFVGIQALVVTAVAIMGTLLGPLLFAAFVLVLPVGVLLFRLVATKQTFDDTMSTIRQASWGMVSPKDGSSGSTRPTAQGEK